MIEIANFNASVEYPGRPAGAARVYRSSSSHSPLSTNFREFPLCEVRAFSQLPSSRIAPKVTRDGNRHMLKREFERPATLSSNTSGVLARI
jgi:hypothetical protein